jgi:hypothetical protein
MERIPNLCSKASNCPVENWPGAIQRTGASGDIIALLPNKLLLPKTRMLFFKQAGPVVANAPQSSHEFFGRFGRSGIPINARKHCGHEFVASRPGVARSASGEFQPFRALTPIERGGHGLWLIPP